MAIILQIHTIYHLSRWTMESMLLVCHDNEVPYLAVAAGGRLNCEFQAFVDKLCFYRSREI